MCTAPLKNTPSSSAITLCVILHGASASQTLGTSSMDRLIRSKIPHCSAFRHACWQPLDCCIELSKRCGEGQPCVQAGQSTPTAVTLRAQHRLFILMIRIRQHLLNPAAGSNCIIVSHEHKSSLQSEPKYIC